MNNAQSKAGPVAIYRDAIEQGSLQPDDRQSAIVDKLQQLYAQVLSGAGNIQASPTPTKEPGFFSWLRSNETRGEPVASAVTGMYLWGGVGRGKTLLCDLFYDSLPFAEKRRVHFHHFMREVHEQLATIKNQTSPLETVAERMLGGLRVLVLDEMHVNDITDAMLMAGLLEQMFSHGVVLLTTSNFEPDELYRDGLQRARFLPAIELIKNHTEVVFLGGDVDYRLRALRNAQTWHSPVSDAAEQSLQQYFEEATGAIETQRNVAITINHRTMQAKQISEHMIWMEFAELCEQARSTDDYIDLANQYDTVLISNIPQMTTATDDYARRFINLIDEFYDRNVNLLVSAEVEPQHLYTGKRLAFEFDRTISRLIEMQSVEYLEQRHQNR